MNEQWKANGFPVHKLPNIEQRNGRHGNAGNVELFLTSDEILSPKQDILTGVDLSKKGKGCDDKLSHIGHDVSFLFLRECHKGRVDVLVGNCLQHIPQGV